MDILSRFRECTGLLVSVRDRDEAEIALAGGADIIDVKEPSRGSLGAADPEAIADVVAAVDGRVPISVAAGELLDWPITRSSKFVELAKGGVSFLKFGLAGCGHQHDWQTNWRHAVNQFTSADFKSAVQPVAVVYADWQAARAPTPTNILALAVKSGCRVLLVDTWSKFAGDLFDHWSTDSLLEFSIRVRTTGIHLVLAGSLKQSSLAEAMRYRFSIIAVRGAACAGDRSGKISLSRVTALRAALTAANASPKCAATVNVVGLATSSVVDE
jgi:(5-formylfuran-3-yl)methyl phosphate synthase